MKYCNINTFSYKLFFVSLLASVCFSCDDTFLTKIHDKKLVIPSTLEDYQALLDNSAIMNGANIVSGCPLSVLGEVATDDFYFDETEYLYLTQTQRDMYVWKESYEYDNTALLNWTLPYRSVFYANNVLDGLKSIERTPNNSKLWDNIYGSALFYRSYVYLHLSQQFIPHYQEDSADKELGLFLKLESDISATINRTTVKKTYEQIEKDLLEAIDYLPETPVYLTRPSKLAVFAALARLYLIKGDYYNALKYSDLTLKSNDELLDYNNLDLTLMYPIPKLNQEVIFHSMMERHVLNFAGRVSDEFLKLYDTHDVRAKAFFNANGNFRGSYDGTYAFFGGLTRSEVYLIRAEASARTQEIDNALADLNRLRTFRITTEYYYPIEIDDANDLLIEVIKERRREMVLRGTSWSDLRRLNVDSQFQRVLKRQINGQEYELLPNDRRYVFQIPRQSLEVGFNID